MSEISRKWTMADATAGLQNEVATMMQGGFRLVGAAALMYVSGVYWEDPRLKASEVADKIHGLLTDLNYGRSSKYQLASAALKVARNLTKKWGQPDGAKDRNAAWIMLHDAASFSEAVDLIVSQIKADYGVDTLRDLYVALDGNKAPREQAAKPLADQFLTAIQKSNAMPDGITTAILAVVDQHLGAGEINALLAALTVRAAETMKAAA